MPAPLWYLICNNFQKIWHPFCGSVKIGTGTALSNDTFWDEFNEHQSIKKALYLMPN